MTHIYVASTEDPYTAFSVPTDTIEFSPFLSTLTTTELNVDFASYSIYEKVYLVDARKDHLEMYTSFLSGNGIVFNFDDLNIDTDGGLGKNDILALNERVLMFHDFLIYMGHINILEYPAKIYCYKLEAEFWKKYPHMWSLETATRCTTPNPERLEYFKKYVSRYIPSGARIIGSYALWLLGWADEIFSCDVYLRDCVMTTFSLDSINDNLISMSRDFPNDGHYISDEIDITPTISDCIEYHLTNDPIQSQLMSQIDTLQVMFDISTSKIYYTRGAYSSYEANYIFIEPDTVIGKKFVELCYLIDKEYKIWLPYWNELEWETREELMTRCNFSTKASKCDFAGSFDKRSSNNNHRALRKNIGLLLLYKNYDIYVERYSLNQDICNNKHVNKKIKLMHRTCITPKESRESFIAWYKSSGILFKDTQQ